MRPILSPKCSKTTTPKGLGDEPHRGRWCQPVACGALCVGTHHVDRVLRHHDRRCAGASRDQGRQCPGVDDAQAGNAVHAHRRTGAPTTAGAWPPMRQVPLGCKVIAPWSRQNSSILGSLTAAGPGFTRASRSGARRCTSDRAIGLDGRDGSAAIVVARQVAVCVSGSSKGLIERMRSGLATRAAIGTPTS